VTANDQPLLERYDGFLFDLDGVVYRGEDAVSNAPAVLEELRRRGCVVRYLTNNSSKTPQQVAGKLAAHRHGDARIPTGGDGIDDRLGAGHDIAPREHPRMTRLQGSRVGDDARGSSDLDPGTGR